MNCVVLALDINPIMGRKRNTYKSTPRNTGTRLTALATLPVPCFILTPSKETFPRCFPKIAPCYWDLDPGSRKPYGKYFASVFFWEFGGWLGEHIHSEQRNGQTSILGAFLGIYIT